MPKKKVTVTYLCKICDHEYSRCSALECEKRGVALPEFKMHQVIKLTGLPGEGADATVSSGYKVHVQNGTKAIVHWDGVDNDNYNPHLLPLYYEIWIATPGHPSNYKKELARFSREYMTPTSIQNGLKCPLCSACAQLSIDIIGHIYIGLGSSILPFMNKLEAYKCHNCNAQFFTDEQSLQVDEIVRKKIKWPVRDTKKLIKGHEFQY